MCINPGKLRSGALVPCRSCWQCRSVIVGDWTGRCIAESKCTWRTLVVTLTYGSEDLYEGKSIDHHNAHVLTYSDVQLYLKRLRLYTNGAVRFMCTGEYGSAKGRAHWHLIAFFKRALPPNLRLEERYVHDAGDGRQLWPHGWSYWQESSPEAIRYACKYIVKDQYHGTKREHRFSKHPPLGFEYFRGIAREYARQGISPRDFDYSFPDVLGKDGKPFPFRMSKSSGYYFALSFMEAWGQFWGNTNWPQSDVLDVVQDELARRDRRRAGEADWSDEDFARRAALITRERQGGWVRGLAGGELSAKPGQFYPLGDGAAYRRASRGE